MDRNHIPVMLEEVLNAFQGLKMRVFVDATLCLGGHSAAILERHPEIGVFVGIDRDKEALRIAEKRLQGWPGRKVLIHGNFADLQERLAENGVAKADAILFDLGFSSLQIESGERGFSFRKDGPLDMRMDRSLALKAGDIVNGWSKTELGKIFRLYGEERRWKMAAEAIVKARKRKPIETTGELADILLRVLFFKRGSRINPLTKVFQALRIAVNEELESIERALPQAIEILTSGGRVAVISFHSLEDRLVKRFFRYAAGDIAAEEALGSVFLTKKRDVRVITRKPLVAAEREVELNPRSRSAKLRVAEKL